MVEMFKPDYVAPVVGYLVSESNQSTTGSLFEVAGGWAGQTRWQRSYGVAFPHKKELTPEAIISKWDAITKFGTLPSEQSCWSRPNLFIDPARPDERATHPSSTQEAIQQIIGNFSESNEEAEEDNPYADSEDSETVAQAKKTAKETGEYSYTERDVMLYNLGIGATEQELHWTFENDDNFGPLPSFGVVPQFPTSSSLPMDFLPNFNPVSSRLPFVRSRLVLTIFYVVNHRLSCYTASNTCLSRSRSLPAAHLSALLVCSRFSTRARPPLSPQLWKLVIRNLATSFSRTSQQCSFEAPVASVARPLGKVGFTVL